MDIVSLFTGAGGLDLGFSKAGFNIIWANEFDKSVWETFEYNFPNVPLDKRDITKINPKEIPDCDGIIGSPPCQSWSEAGAGRGIDDERGKLFYNYIEILKAKQPKFFLAENVSGILHTKHSDSFNDILKSFKDSGYIVSYKLVDANDYNVPQNRLRVFIVGIRKDIRKEFIFPSIIKPRPVLKDAIYGLEENNQEYLTGGFSSMYMSRNRVRSWNEPSFTIQAGGRHAPIHPSAPKMIKIDKDKWIFQPGYQYRRLSIRECARIQTFPDSFTFKYKKIADGYKMIGNAVPVNLAFAMATQLSNTLFGSTKELG